MPETDATSVVVEGLDRPLLSESAADEAEPIESGKKGSLDRIRSTRIRSQRFNSMRSVNFGDDVAFKITVRSQSRGPDDFPGIEEGEEITDSHMDIDVCHNTVSEAIQGAVENAVQEVVQDAVQGAVQDAVQQVMDDTRVKFDVRANFYTLIAITGVVIFWRGVWTTWDYFFGFAIWSELGAIATGLGIMVFFRLMHLPLLDGLPSG
ncbi:hypothetical protein WJX73_006111 [Symbiochloris irregularis]|uniref:Uncharacterized protein n=1 Tax=Symbiochloris irregularis TaxID=706552 RepID=A0AAW1PUX4_9CHLO